jgi:serine phosphatase RsbU (regulator of sigma subunit)
VRFAFRIEPWEHLGGDFVDVHVDRGGDVTFMIADVSGHGAEAAMLTAVVKSAFQDERSDNRPPQTVVQKIWRAIRFFEAQFFITAICARYRPDEELLEWVNAGHPSGLIVAPDGSVTEMDSTGALLSPALETTWEVRQRKLRPGSRVFLYTDGASEAEGSRGEFGHDRLAEIVRTSSAHGPALLDEAFAAVFAHMDLGPPHDDVAMVTVRVG